ncbi:MAG: ParA family protein [Rickettsiales bacterium]|jgi:cellulose biosynthesis protein BcsQ|nr:ParA family protein [Rickettsiales bacterium]
MASVKYCVWNNKGGVGKSFLTYSLAVEYAIRNPGKKVVVFDLCPQANISAMLLGGDGKGEDNLTTLSNLERTVSGYIKQRYDSSRFGKIGRELSYFVKINDFNGNMPENMYLLPGDTDLDLCAQLIDYIASAPEKNAWFKSRKYVSDLIDVFNDEYGEDNTCFFIDTNPSFANYTQLGILAANRFIIPCTADSFSLRGLYNLFRLVYGEKLVEGLLSDAEIFTTFHERAEKEAGHVLPRIHSLILNKSRTFDKKASKAYMAHVNEIEKLINFLETKFPSRFVPLPTGSGRVYNMKDANAIPTVLNFCGIAPSKLKHQKYDVYDDTTQINQSQIDPYLANINSIVSIL